MRISSRLLAAAGIAATASAFTAQAQTPPIKAGLWEVQVEREGGTKMPDMNEHLKNMPPEQRKRMEAMMKERGVDMSGGMNKLKICFDKESLDQERWKGEHDSRCKTDMSNRGSTSWKWHSVCGEPYHSVTDGEATFTSSESYVVKSSTTMTMKGETKTVKTTVNSKWLGSDCGDVKPVQALKQPVPQRPKQK